MPLERRYVDFFAIAIYSADRNINTSGMVRRHAIISRKYDMRTMYGVYRPAFTTNQRRDQKERMYVAFLETNFTHSGLKYMMACSFLAVIIVLIVVFIIPRFCSTIAKSNGWRNSTIVLSGDRRFGCYVTLRYLPVA